LINGITPNKSSVQQRGQSTVKRQLAKCRKYLQTICPAKATTNIQKKKPQPQEKEIQTKSHKITELITIVRNIKCYCDHKSHTCWKADGQGKVHFCRWRGVPPTRVRQVSTPSRKSTQFLSLTQVYPSP
jgi:hypothetical protein